MCSAFNSDCGYDSSLIILSGDVFCPNTRCSGKLCLHKKLFNLSAEANINARKARLVGNIPFEDQTNSFFLSLGQGVYIFEETPKSAQDVCGDVYSPGKHCYNREKCESIEGYVTTPRSIYGCGKYGAWLFVHKVPFMLQKHVKTTKTDKTGFFFAKRR